MQDTPSSSGIGLTALSVPSGLGLGVIDHLLPFQDSTNVLRGRLRDLPSRDLQREELIQDVLGGPGPEYALMNSTCEPSCFVLPERVAVPLPLSAKVTLPGSFPCFEMDAVGLPVVVTVNEKVSTPSPTVLTHARRRRVRHAQRRPRTSCLGRGPRLQRAARVHHRRPARRGRPRGTRPRARRRPLERAVLAPPAGHGQPGPVGRAQGRRRASTFPSPSASSSPPARSARPHRGAGVLRRARPQRVAPPRPGHDRPGRRHGAVRPRRAPLRRARGGARARRAGPRGGRRWPSWPGCSGVSPHGHHHRRRRPRTMPARYPTWPTCAARPSAGAPSRWRPPARTIS